MNKMMKKLSFCLVVIFLISSLFVGCGQEDNIEETSSSETSSGETSNKETEEFSYPMDKSRKITYWGGINDKARTQFTSASEMPYYQELLKEIGITVEFLDPPQGQKKEQLNLLIASGEYPDIIEYNWGTFPGGPDKAIEDGIIIPLNNILNDHAPNLKSIYDEHSEWDKMAKTDTGNYYMFPFIRKDDSLRVFFGPIVRQDWLDDLGLDQPETMDEWYNMLVKFRDEKGATAPLSYESWMLDYGDVFMGGYGVSAGFYVEEEVVKYGPITTEYKEFLKEFSKWYKEGLIDKDIATIDKKQVAAKVMNGQAGATLGFASSRLGMWLAQMEDKDPNYDLTGTKYPVANKGDIPRFGQKDFPVTDVGAAITTGCKDVEAAARFLDFIYDEKGQMIYNFGIEGESYSIVDGEPIYTDLILNNPEGLTITEVLSRYIKANSDGPGVQDERYYEQTLPFSQQKEAIDRWAQTEIDTYGIPLVTPLPEESEEQASIMNQVNTYKKEMFYKFLFGEEDVEEKFDEYVANIENMGIDRAKEIQQKAYERYLYK